MELKFGSGFRVIGEYLSQIDSQYRVNLWLSFLGQNDSIFSFSAWRWRGVTGLRWLELQWVSNGMISLQRKPCCCRPRIATAAIKLRRTARIVRTRKLNAIEGILSSPGKIAERVNQNYDKRYSFNYSHDIDIITNFKKNVLIGSCRTLCDRSYDFGCPF